MKTTISLVILVLLSATAFSQARKVKVTVTTLSDGVASSVLRDIERELGKLERVEIATSQPNVAIRVSLIPIKGTTPVAYGTAVYLLVRCPGDITLSPHFLKAAFHTITYENELDCFGNSIAKWFDLKLDEP